MKGIGQLLLPALGREEILRAARARRVLRAWQEIVGETLGSRSCPDRYDHGTVFVAVEGSAWAQELRMAKTQILKRLQERAGDPSVFLDLRFGVRRLVPLELIEEVAVEAAIETEPDERTIREIANERLRAWRADGS